MGKIIILSTSIILLLSSCATILNSKYQTVIIENDEAERIFIDGDEVFPVEGRLYLRRDYHSKQITIRSEGFKDENIAMIPYKRSGLYTVSWIPFGVFLFPPLMDMGPKSFDYSKFPIKYTMTPFLSEKLEGEKKMRVLRVGVDLNRHSLRERVFDNYQEYYDTAHDTFSVSMDLEVDIDIYNTQFTEVMNELLTERGYIDSTLSLFENGFNDNLLVEASISKCTLHDIGGCKNASDFGMIYVDLEIDWEILDYYGETIHELKIKSRSGQIAVLGETWVSDKESAFKNAIKDAMWSSLIKLLDSEEMIATKSDFSEVEKELASEEIILSRPIEVVENLTEGIKSTATIQTPQGFGSAFLISADGYLITNYHVIADSEEIEVILNDQSKHKGELVRASRLHDIALLKIDTIGLIPFEMQEHSDFEIAQDIYAIGTPSDVDLAQTISRGIISGVRGGEETKFIQTDASVNSGNSGGPLVDKSGKVIGVVTSKLTGLGVEGVAFGIPTERVFEGLKIKFE